MVTQFLHNQCALALKARLLYRPNTVVTSVPVSWSEIAMDVAVTGATRTHRHRAGRRPWRGRPPADPARAGRAATGDAVAWDPKAATIDAAALEGIDAVVHLAGAGIGDHRWNDAYKREIVDSRVPGHRRCWPGRWPLFSSRPACSLSASAVGWYGDRGDEVLDETSPSGTGFLADVCRQWEAADGPPAEAGIRVAHLRTGIVLSPKGGALKKQLPLFKLGLGGRFGTGRQWQSWIALDDEVGAIVHLLAADVAGPVNLTAPNPVTAAEFTKHARHRAAPALVSARALIRSQAAARQGGRRGTAVRGPASRPREADRQRLFVRLPRTRGRARGAGSPLPELAIWPNFWGHPDPAVDADGLGVHVAVRHELDHHRRQLFFVTEPRREQHAGLELGLELFGRVRPVRRSACR